MAVEHGDGWSLSTLDDLGEGPGFRKIRKELGVTAFGINAIVLPAGDQPTAIDQLFGVLAPTLAHVVQTLRGGGRTPATVAEPHK